MKYFFLSLIVITQGVKAQSSKVNNFSNTDKKHLLIYVLKYYYPEEPGKIISTRAYSRSEDKDRSFCMTDHNTADLS